MNTRHLPSDVAQITIHPLSGHYLQLSYNTHNKQMNERISTRTYRVAHEFISMNHWSHKVVSLAITIHCLLLCIACSPTRTHNCQHWSNMVGIMPPSIYSADTKTSLCQEVICFLTQLIDEPVFSATSISTYTKLPDTE